MANEQAAEGAAPESPGPGKGRRPRLGILFAFLAVLVLLLVAFRGVLFPFLMAIFIAYLIEPVVQAFTRSPIFGVRWTRGPTIVLMYAVLLTAIVLATSCAAANVTAYVRGVSRDVTRALRETAERARFTVDPGTGTSVGFARDVLIPTGTRVVLRPYQPAPGPERAGEEPPSEPEPPPPPRVYRTVYDAVIRAGETEATVLLEETDESLEDGAPVGLIRDLNAVRYVDEGDFRLEASRLHVSVAEHAVGLEVFIESNLITPIVQNLAKAGIQVQPTELRNLLKTQAQVLGENLPEKVTRWGRSLVTSVALGVYEFILILMLTAFIVMDRKGFTQFFASLPPPHVRERYQTLVRYVDRGLAGVIRGQLMICLVNGLLTYLGLFLFQVKGALVLAILAGIFSLIPIFGTIISSIPIVLVAATDGLDKGAFALAWICFIHLLEANLLNPLIMGTHARMHPIIVIFALLAGEHAYGVWGALLAVPTASVIQSCFLFYRHEIEGVPFEPPRPHALWLRSLFDRLMGRRDEKEAEA